MRSGLLAAAPGVVALVVATVALVDEKSEPPAATVTAPAPSAAATAPLPSFAALVDRVDGTVARIDARRGPDQPPFANGRRTATGAAFLIDDRGHLVTNAHVVDRARSATVRFGRSARRIPARIVGRDRATDLAVLRVPVARLAGERPLELAPDGSVRAGDPALAVGTPFRLQGSASAGIVSATGREIRGLTGFTIPDVVQTDAAINPGNSGGPLLDARGRVIGVNSQGRGPGVSFAVSAATVRRVVPQLIARGVARTGYLGVGLGEISDRGTRVDSVTDGGPADRAGVHRGDVVTRAGSRATNTEGALTSAIAATRPGATLVREVRRDGATRTLRVRVGRQPARAR